MKMIKSKILLKTTPGKYWDTNAKFAVIQEFAAHAMAPGGKMVLLIFMIIMERV